MIFEGLFQPKPFYESMTVNDLWRQKRILVFNLFQNDNSFGDGSRFSIAS